MAQRADEPPTSASLLDRLADPRDETAWRLFLDRYLPLIRTWCGRWGLSAEERDEIAAEVLLRLTRAMPRFQYDAQGSFRRWLRTVVANALRDLARTRARTPGGRGTGDSAALAALHQIEAPDSIESLTDALNQRLERDRRLARQALPLVQQRVEPRTWEAFWLTAVEQLPGAEVAAKLGMKVTAVHMAKSRVGKMLREEIARLDEPSAPPPTSHEHLS